MVLFCSTPINYFGAAVSYATHRALVLLLHIATASYAALTEVTGSAALRMLDVIICMGSTALRYTPGAAKAQQERSITDCLCLFKAARFPDIARHITEGKLVPHIVAQNYPNIAISFLRIVIRV